MFCGSKSWTLRTRRWKEREGEELIAFSRITNLLHQQLHAANKFMIYVIMNFMPFSRFFFMLSRSMAHERDSFPSSQN